jgi:mannose-1-phosphate guanylyltransferase
MKWAVILAGGAGTRFWPLSTPDSPKQILPLAGDRPSIQDAVDRLDGFVPPERILLVTGRSLAPHLQRIIRLPEANILLEPRAASTGPALVWATMEAARRDPDAQVLTTHADWAIPDPAAFRDAAAQALETAATHDRLVTVGIVPSRPETGYGYIVPGPALDHHARQVARFTEKPDGATALDLIAGGALWNSGLFAWTERCLIREVEAATPEIAPALPFLREGNVEEFFSQVTPISIDVGVLERSNAVAVVPGGFVWDDIGTWEAIHRIRQRDVDGNVVVGPGFANDSEDCVVWSDGDPIVLDGVKDLVVVHANGRILVMSRTRATDLKRVLNQLPAEVRDMGPANQ